MKLSSHQNYDRKSELTAFDETKSGVKGLVDAEITTVPRIFIVPSSEKPNSGEPPSPELNLPIIDLYGINEDPIRRKEVIEQVKNALGSWGFFQMVNHGIPDRMLEEIKKGVLGFFEQDNEVKKEWYSRGDRSGKLKLVYNSNFDLYSAPVANWRDTFYCPMAPDPPQPHELPSACRDILMEYSKEVMKLGINLFKLISEALQLNPDHLIKLGCAEGLAVLGHYYPPCPQPELAIGTNTHTDNTFITILLQDEIGGLQLLHQNHWINIPPNPKALVANVGDLLQLISNDKVFSAQHRVLANKIGPRVSVASFFTTGDLQTSMVCEPIKELISEENPAKYRSITVKEYHEHFNTKGLNGISALLRFKI
ncbi:1-aminocyclopropane-1-carboxylate oxidase homolog 1 [Lactuca sativa]|uniref:Fe2OG dioxygenase domain-containing protein n=1 Tax=Lactuca sativa TaxID=4236 RepID=A0A9R1XKX3_LACSA|nr:1-aminocyclopropane-1-carboxylate oxidase homolog 1 [Lactuca sativa]KAJ0218590.1 hypothetical protein LSAT_V11C300150530 [Lactuca sativa]